MTQAPLKMKSLTLRFSERRDFGAHTGLMTRLRPSTSRLVGVSTQSSAPPMAGPATFSVTIAQRP